MNFKLKIFAVFILTVLALAALGYLKAIPAFRGQVNAPKIEISPMSFDFGDVEFRTIVTQNFKIKNSGNDALEIRRVATSCSCTTARVSQEEIAPGAEADLLVTYDTAAMGSGPHGKGKQERIIYVKSNDAANPQVEVKIEAVVK